jgi:RNase P protein component
MIPAKFRLQSGGFKAAGFRTIRTPHFSLKFKDNDTGVNRIGVVVGKSVDRRAVRRNFWERQAKVQLLKAPKLKKDILLVLFPKVTTLTKKQFAEELKKTLSTLLK